MLSVKQARITSVVFGALAAISLGGFVYQSQQSHVLPIAVTFDQAGKAGQVFLPAGYVPTYQNKQSFMVQWISYAFSWTTSQSVNTERRTFLAASTADAANKDYIAWFNASLTDTERLVKIELDQTHR